MPPRRSGLICSAPLPHIDQSIDRSNIMQREVGAYDAKTKLPQLLREVAQGDRITITVRGRPVAELVPARQARSPAAGAVAAMGAFDPIAGIESETLAEWIREGRA